MTRPLQCLTSLVVLALVLGQSAHCVVVKQSSVPGSKTPLYDRSIEGISRRFCAVTIPSVDNTEYEKRCGEKSDPKWPCFKNPDSVTFRLKYYDYDDKTGYYKIHLQGTYYRRIFVSDGNGNDRDIDTEHHLETGKLLCSKWITVDIVR
ncbi:uncharacterized protein UDID_17809 [Ustilago sp. UG-2017a]|nr:uncharacterized protein UDID_17809 [Ustilago sp. UG-2017a]